MSRAGLRLDSAWGKRLRASLHGLRRRGGPAKEVRPQLLDRQGSTGHAQEAPTAQKNDVQLHCLVVFIIRWTEMSLLLGSVKEKVAADISLRTRSSQLLAGGDGVPDFGKQDGYKIWNSCEHNQMDFAKTKHV